MGNNGQQVKVVIPDPGDTDSVGPCKVTGHNQDGNYVEWNGSISFNDGEYSATTTNFWWKGTTTATVIVGDNNDVYWDQADVPVLSSSDIYAIPVGIGGPPPPPPPHCQTCGVEQEVKTSHGKHEEKPRHGQHEEKPAHGEHKPSHRAKE